MVGGTKDTKRATAANKAAESTRVMGASRRAIALSALILLWTGLLIYANNTKDIAGLGLPGALAIGTSLLVVVKYLEKGNHATDRAEHVEQGAAAEEKAGESLDSFHQRLRESPREGEGSRDQTPQVPAGIPGPAPPTSDHPGGRTDR